MSDMQCPYCGAEQEVCHDDGHGYQENVSHEHQCTECQKTFVFETSVSFHYEPSKADCLNGASHDLRLTTTRPKEYTRWCCKHCDYEREMTDAERAAHGINTRRG